MLHVALFLVIELNAGAVPFAKGVQPDAGAVPAVGANARLLWVYCSPRGQLGQRHIDELVKGIPDDPRTCIAAVATA